VNHQLELSLALTKVTDKEWLVSTEFYN
jgi:hypothetical protein